MSWDPDDFSGPLNFDAAAAIEMLDANVADRLIALLDSNEPIDGLVRSELANALRRGKQPHCEVGTFSMKLIGLNRARKASYYGQKERFDTMFAQGLKIQNRLDSGKATSIPNAIKQLDNCAKGNGPRKMRYAHDHYMEVQGWIDGLEKPPFWIKETEEWRDNTALRDHYNGIMALRHLDDKNGGA